ncbi:hypothetical protein CB1_000305013 [Camelus ferus]|nr:hypothetical protein CB1_000305013 [Camelus ferus]
MSASRTLGVKQARDQTEKWATASVDSGSTSAGPVLGTSNREMNKGPEGCVWLRAGPRPAGEKGAVSASSVRDPDMELREEAWSPGPLDSEDQQMASHENPEQSLSLQSQCQRTVVVQQKGPEDLDESWSPFKIKSKIYFILELSSADSAVIAPPAAWPQQ